MKKLILLLLLPLIAFAEGMDSSFKFAWSDTLGWVNFNPTNGNVQVFSDRLTGYAWSENYGWINLNPTNGGVINDGNGNLSGYAWGENIGWIDFSNVKINPNTGEFSGYALILGGPGGRINFDCNNCKVVTLWRKTKHPPSSFFPEKKLVIDENLLRKTLTDVIEKFLKEKIVEIPRKVKKIIEKKEKLIPEIKESKITYPLKLTYTLQNKSLKEFISSYFPEEIKILSSRIPKLGEIFNKIGLNNLVNLEKLKVVKLYLPSLSEILEINLPLFKLPQFAKKKIPEEIVFIRSQDEKIDLKPRITLDEKNNIVQEINIVAGQKIKLIVKPIAEVESIKGYLVYLSYKRSFLEKFLSLVSAKEVENRLEIFEFEYEDQDKDGIYTAEITLPKLTGKFEIKTIIEYKSVDLGKKEIRLITAIDPEGYIYEKILGREARIEGAEVSLYYFNPQTNKFELWPAKEYGQLNPQITDKSGNYAFLVPSGRYYLEVKKDGYFPYKSEIFDLQENGALHLDIELKSKTLWFLNIDWKLILLILISLLLIFQVFRNKIKSEIKNE